MYVALIRFSTRYHLRLSVLKILLSYKIDIAKRCWNGGSRTLYNSCLGQPRNIDLLGFTACLRPGFPSGGFQKPKDSSLSQEISQKLTILKLMNYLNPKQILSASAIWQTAVKRRSLLHLHLKQAIVAIVGSHSLSWVKASASFSWFVIRMIRANGNQGLAIYLKASNLLLIRAVAGKKLEDPRLAGAAVSTTEGGLPRIICSSHRLRIKGGDKACIRFWLGLFTLYRVLPFRGRLSVESILKPGVELSDDFLASWKRFLTDRFWVMLNRSFGVQPIESELTNDDLLEPGKRFQREKSYWRFPSLEGTRRLLMSSGPGSFVTAGSSIISHGYDAFLWSTADELWPYLKAMCLITGNIHFIDSIPFTLAQDEETRELNRNVHGIYELGKLSIREEPGKLRVFAMVDSITQWVLYPLHKALFKILGVIPQDGTFDQLKPVNKMMELLKAKGTNNVWSYDLSSATDRIPVVLQELTLVGLTSNAFAFYWRSLLCNRYYQLPKEWLKTFGLKGLLALNPSSYEIEIRDPLGPSSPGKYGPWRKERRYATAIKYAVGQPMGAYSSWAMLALVHHALVQFAAFRAGWRSWFPLYAVLGDDVVIGDHNVADQYTRVMKEIGVDIGFHKSVISSNLSCEFAKKFFYKGEEVTPLPLVGISSGWLGATFVPEVIKISERLTGKKLSGFNIARFLGVGFKAGSGADNRPFLYLPKILSRVLILLHRPGAPRGVANLFDWLRLHSSMSAVETDQKARTSLTDYLVKWCKTERFPRLLLLMSSNMEKFVPAQTYEGSTKIFEVYAKWFHNYIREPLMQDFTIKRMEVEAILRGMSTIILPTEKEVCNLLSAVDSFEDLIGEIPSKVLRHSSQMFGKAEALATANRARRLVTQGPTSVKRFRALKKILGSSLKVKPLVTEGGNRHVG